MTVARTPEAQRLLDLVAAHMLEYGTEGLSLSRLAKDIGSNNRMLLYYFDSKEALFAAGLRAAYARFPELTGLTAGLSDAGDLPVQVRAAWRSLRAPENLPYLRLFFETFARAARDPSAHGALFADLAAEWPAQIRAAFAAHGWDEEDAATATVQLLAVWRGLQFAVLEGGDVAAIDAAHDGAVAALFERG